VTVWALAQDLSFACGIGVADPEAHQEAIELAFGERVSAVMLGWILGGDDHERVWQRQGAAIYGYLAFVHCFEQCALGFGRGAVDFVSEQEVGEDGAGFEFELFRVGVVDGDAQNVAGQHVAGELQAVEAAIDRAGQALGKCGFAYARDVFDEEVAAGEQANYGEADRFLLAAQHCGECLLKGGRGHSFRVHGG
jgi:hypothetical protein